MYIMESKVAGAGIFKQSLGARNRVGIGLSYRPAMLHSGGIDTLESILGLLKSLKFGLWTRMIRVVVKSIKVTSFRKNVYLAGR
jgi:hypothetical protein